MSAADVPASMPQRIGRYELLFPIGTGGMGTVYLGRHELLPGVFRNVAVKLMHSELRANPEIAPQLMREAQLAAAIQHPNVVALLEAGDGPHGVFLVLDFVEGDTLAGVIRAARKREERVPLRIAGKILRDALTGLHAAHELRGEDGRALDLVHRDFSPHNILVGMDGNSLLTDFGIAKALSHANATATGIVKGKVGYMAPEQARGERVDRRSDVWAAGVVAWEVLTARRLFRGANDAATLLQVVSGKRPPLVSSSRRDVPDRLDEAIAAALEPKPQRRTASANALRKQLEEALVDSGGVADAEEVAEYVRDLIGHKVEENRERAQSVLALRAQIADISETAQTAAETTGTTMGTPPSVSEFRDISETRNALSAVTDARPASSRRWLGALALIVIGGASAFYVMSTKPSSEPTSQATALSQASATTPSPSATSSTETARPNALKIHANEPIAQLRLDDKTLVIPDATVDIEIPLTGDRPTKVVALTSDGRAATTQLAPDARAIELAFPPKPATSASDEPSASAEPSASTRPPARAPAHRRPGPAAPPTQPGTSGDDGLADSPYGAK